MRVPSWISMRSARRRSSKSDPGHQAQRLDALERCARAVSIPSTRGQCGSRWMGIGNPRKVAFRSLLDPQMRPLEDAASLSSRLSGSAAPGEVDPYPGNAASAERGQAPSGSCAWKRPRCPRGLDLQPVLEMHAPPRRSETGDRIEPAGQLGLDLVVEETLSETGRHQR